jgi:Zn-dependent protease with chaperone function
LDLRLAVSAAFPKSAKDFRLAGLAPYARLALCTAFLFSALQLSASDGRSSCASGPAADPADSEHSSVQLEPGPEARPANSEKPANPEKYDVNRIGQRNTGKGMNLYSLEKERALGQSMAETIDRQTKFVTDPDIIKYVSGVVQRIIGNSDAQVAFTIKVIDSTDLNIFALPGGFLYVDKGLLIELDSEAELAGLIAHEVAHVAARHGTRYATRRTAWNLISFPAIYMAGPGAIGARQIGPLALRKFARDAELEADLLGMEYQYAAGYDPRAFVDALERLHNEGTSGGKHKGSFGRSLHQIAKAYAFYPPMEERIGRLESEISTVLPCRDTYVTDTSEFQEIKGQLLADELVLHRDHVGHGEDGENGGPVLHRHPTEWQEPQAVHTAFLSDTKSFTF